MSNYGSNYSSYTYDYPNFLVRYPHGRRYRLVAKKIREIGPKSWLDFGAGNDALLVLLCHINYEMKTIVGSTSSPNVVIGDPVASNTLNSQ